MKRILTAVVAVALAVTAVSVGTAQVPAIENELALITPVSKFIHDAALKAFAEYA